MAPDVNLKSYYLQFISNAKTDSIKYKESLEQTIKIKEQLYNYLEGNSGNVFVPYNIDVINLKEYDPEEKVYTKVINLLDIVEDNSRIMLHQLIKYCGALKSEHKYKELIKLTDTRKDIKFGVYRTLLSKYFNKVHETVLQGMGYSFGYGIGTYCINHWKINKTTTNKGKRLDYNATNIRKRELLAAGTKIYDDKEATWYKQRNIPYDGVEYRVFVDANSFYEFTFIKSKLFNTHSINIKKTSSLDYQRTEYVALKLRGMSFTEMADRLCNTYEDIYNLPVDIKYKLNIILHKDPTKYLNFIRNAEQLKYKRGAHNS